MTLAEAFATPIKQRRSSRRIALRRADLGDLVVEVQSMVDEQLSEHAKLSRLILEDRGREAVMDTSFERAMQNARHQAAFGDRATMDTALDRIERVHTTDEADEDALIVALLRLLGAHNLGANDLRRLIRVNGRAITHGEPVALTDAFVSGAYTPAGSDVVA